MSHQATTWALNAGAEPGEQRVGDTCRKYLLVAMADHAHKDGRNAWAAVETYADYLECSERTVQRHLRRLLEDGFIRVGDQDLVGHIRRDRRPVVYDLAMSESTRARWAAERNGEGPDSRGDNLSPRPDGDDPTPLSPREAARPDTTVTPSTTHGVTHGVTETPSRGDTGVTQTKEPQNLPPQPPASGGSPATPTSPSASSGCASCRGQRPCRACGTTPRQQETADQRAEAARRRDEAQAQLDAQRAARGRTLADPQYAEKLEHHAAAARAAARAATQQARPA